MARWKPLADDLDPQIKEFTSQLRRTVERGGISLSALADATGYSRSSWERYLNGRMLPPKYAVVALADATGAEPVHLTTMWELAERAWSRTEGRHDHTMEAQQVARARTALAEDGPPPRDAPPKGPAGGDGKVIRSPERSRTIRRAVLLAAGVALSVAAVAGAVVLLDDGDKGKNTVPVGGTTRTPTAEPLPEGVECVGGGCTGEDPETMGCADDDATTAASAWVGGTYIEMRYSPLCEAVWARISVARAGDSVNVTDVQGERKQSSRTAREPTTYTPMMAVASPADAKACAELATGTKGCTPPGSKA